MDGAIPEPAGWPLEGQVVRPTPLRGVGVKKKYAATVKINRGVDCIQRLRDYDHLQKGGGWRM